VINLSKFLPFFISNVNGAFSFFTNLDLFCIDNARVIYRKIRYFKLCLRTKQVHRAKSNGREHRGSKHPRNSVCKVRDGRQTYNSVVAAQTHNFPGSNFSTFVLEDHHLLNLSFHSHFPRHRFRAANISVSGRHYLIGRALGCSAPVWLVRNITVAGSKCQRSFIKKYKQIKRYPFWLVFLTCPDIKLIPLSLYILSSLN